MVAPLFFLMVFGTIDIGRVIWANDAVANAAREGARYASVHAGNIDRRDLATKDMIRAHALNFVFAAGREPDRHGVLRLGGNDGEPGRRLQRRRRRGGRWTTSAATS